MMGRRIMVCGPTGSGKTTVARRIGELLHLPMVELDALFWRPNWQPTPAEEFRAKVLDTLNARDGGWVCDGNYSALRDAILPMADTVLWLRVPFRVAFWRLLKRTMTRAWTREPLWGSNYESWRQSFLSKESILLWCVTHWRAHHRNFRRALREIPHRATVVELRSSHEVEDLLASLEADGGQRFR